MKTINLTLSVEDHLIDLAQEQAAKEHKTLEAMFLEGLKNYLRKGVQARYAQTKDEKERMAMLERSRACIADMRRTIRTGGRKFTRDEMNER